MNTIIVILTIPVFARTWAMDLVEVLRGPHLSCGRRENCSDHELPRPSRVAVELARAVWSAGPLCLIAT